MKQTLRFLAATVVVVLAAACHKGQTPQKTSIPGTQEPTEEVLTTLPQPAVSLGSSLATLKEKEASLKSELLKEEAFAGYIKLDYKTVAPNCPRRIYLVKQSTDKLAIAGLYLLPVEHVWKEDNMLQPAMITLFEKEGYRYERRVDHDNRSHHYFLKPMSTDEHNSEYIECVVQREKLDDIEYATISMRITDVIAG